MTKIIKGSGGGGKGGGGKARTPVEAPDSLRSIQYANVVDLISEGECEGLLDELKSVYFDDTPVQNPDDTYNFKNVTMLYRNGSQDQDPIPGFSNSSTEVPVSVEIVKASPVVRTITNLNTDSARVTLSVPRLTNQSLTTGDTNGTSVAIGIEVQANGGGYVGIPLRNTFQNTFSIASGVYTNTVEGEDFRFTVTWTKENVRAGQTCTFKLQYRAVGDTDWIDEASHTFSGAPPPDTRNGIAFVGLGLTTTPAAETKTFNVNLASGFYEFRVLKTAGSRSDPSPSFGFILASVIVPRAPLTGLAYGGSVAITTYLVNVPTLNDVITGKTTSKYQRSYTIPLNGTGPWDIRVTRITADSTNSVLQNQTFWDSYTEVIEENFSYPNCMIVATQIDAEQFARIPVRRFEIKGIKVRIPSNYDPLQRSYDGAWDGNFVTAWTNNPAWIFYDLATKSRYGLGDLISEDEIDKWQLYSIAQYCDVSVPDGFGGYEPRFTCNLYLQTREEAYQVMLNLASAFRAMVFWASSEIFVSQDTPSDPVQLFSAANVADGAFEYSGSSARVRHNVVLVTWNDPEDGYRTKVEYISDDESIALNGVVQTELTAFGCTSRGQAVRVGKWLIYSEKYETEVVNFRAGIANIYAQAGDVIAISDPNRSGVRHGGRIASATTTSITIDKAISIEVGVDYEISVVLSDGTIETRTVTSPVGSRTIITVDTPFTSAPQAFAMWLVSSTSVAVEYWKIVSASEANKTDIDISALSYNPTKYDFIEDSLELQEASTSLINAQRPTKPQGFLLEEYLYLSGLGVVSVGITISWENTYGSKSYVLEYYTDNENRKVITTEETTVDIRPIEEGLYYFELTATNVLGKVSETLMVEQTIFGKTTPPGDVLDFSLSPLGSFGIFSWTESVDLDVLVGGRVV
jgi:predicted phage tail protein